MSSKKPKKAWIKKDPFAQREAEKYERPIPSREYILQTLKQSEGPLDFAALTDRMGISDPIDQEVFNFRLKAMLRDGQLVCNRKNAYLPVDEAGLLRGRVIAHSDGFGFLRPDSGGDDIFLPPRQMRGLFDGDKVVVRITGIDRRGRKEGAIVEVLERNTTRLVGRLEEEDGVAFVMPDNKRLLLNVLIPPGQKNKARSGQIVLCEITHQPTKRTAPIGKIIEILGEHMDPGMEIHMSLHNYDIPFIWPEDVSSEIRGFSSEVVEEDKTNRVDLRHLPLVTIDGEDARDFDDAVFCERLDTGEWRLIVAIADVSHYVVEDTALDLEAQRRGNSVYFPGRVIPMLPEVLSNGLCSLNPQVDRLAMVADMVIGKGGALKKYEFYQAIICSSARLTYTEVARILVDQDPIVSARRSKLLPHLNDLYSIYHVLTRARRRRGAIDFETQETRIVFGETRKIEQIIPVQRNDAHKLIEECMIVANVAAARFLQQSKMPTLYRIHEKPDPDRLEILRTFLHGLGLTLEGGSEPTPKDYEKLMEKIAPREDASIIQTMMLRSLQQAVYAPENKGHFGLALAHYAHFTSPIRRYPDLLVHRAIRHVLSGKSVEHFFYDQEKMFAIGENCSMTERRADEAVRDVVDWLKCEYMQDKLGESFPGIVSTVTAFGLFVQIKELFVEGLVHVTALQNDYYRFDPVGQCLRGERSGQIYRLGDQIRIQVARVDLQERKIDFVLDQSDRREISGRQKPSKKGSRKKKKALRKKEKPSRKR